MLETGPEHGFQRPRFPYLCSFCHTVLPPPLPPQRHHIYSLPLLFPTSSSSHISSLFPLINDGHYVKSPYLTQSSPSLMNTDDRAHVSVSFTPSVSFCVCPVFLVFKCLCVWHLRRCLIVLLLVEWWWWCGSPVTCASDDVRRVCFFFLVLFYFASKSELFTWQAVAF